MRRSVLTVVLMTLAASGQYVGSQELTVATPSVEHFRWRRDDGGEGASGATWSTALDTGLTDQARNQNIRLRLAIGCTTASGDYQMDANWGPVRLEYATSTNSSAVWAPVPVADYRTVPVRMRPTVWYTNGACATKAIGSSSAWVARGAAVCAPSNGFDGMVLLNGQECEAEFCIELTAKAAGGTNYYFRPRLANQTVFNYKRFPSVAAPAGVANEAAAIVSPVTAVATNGDWFQYRLQASGDEPVTYGVSGLPAGLVFDGMSTFSGTPLATGAFNVTMWASNAAGRDTRTLALTVRDGLPPNIMGPGSTDARANEDFSCKIDVAGTEPIALAVSNLPVGLTFDGIDRITGWVAASGDSVAQVYAANPFGNTCRVLTIHVAPPARPRRPGSLTVNPVSSTQLRVDWSDDAVDETGYRLERSRDNRIYQVVAHLPANADTFTDSGLAAGGLYIYRVCATNAVSESEFSNWNYGVTQRKVGPVEPRLVFARWMPADSVRLTWEDDFEDETGYVVERMTTTSGVYVSVANLPPGSSNYVDAGVPLGTYLTYRVCAVRGAVRSSAATRTAYLAEAWSHTSAFCYPGTVPVPTNLRATVTDGYSLRLAWDPIADTSATYQTYLSWDDVKYYAQLPDSGTNTYAIHEPIFPGYSHYYRVVASLTNGTCSGPSATLRVDPPAPSAAIPSPRRLRVVPSGNELAIYWQDCTTNETGFVVECSIGSGARRRVAMRGPNATRAVWTNWDSCVLSVQALTPQGESPYSQPIAVTAPASYTPPTVLANLSAVASSSWQVNLSWTRSGGATAIAERSVAGGSFETIGCTNGASFVDRWTSASRQYTYRVRLDDGRCSNTATVTTPADGTAPTAPSSLTAAGASRRQINLAWKDNSRNETGFDVERSTDGGANYSPMVTVRADDNTWSDTNAPLGATCWYRVRAANANGVSAWAGPISATPAGTDPSLSVTTRQQARFREFLVTGTAANDNILIEQNASNILVSFNGGVTQSLVGPFGAVIVKGGRGDDAIRVGTSVTCRCLLYGGKGNDRIEAFGSGRTIIVALGEGRDVCVGNGTNTSYWVDRSDRDTILASAPERNTARIHRVFEFCQPWSADPNNGNYVSKELDGQNYPEPGWGFYPEGCPSYPTNSFLGTGPSVLDVDQGLHQNCPVTGRFGAIANQNPDVLEEFAVDLGDGTYAFQLLGLDVNQFFRHDGQINPPTVGGFGPSGSQWWPIMEKVYDFGFGMPAPSTAETRTLRLSADPADLESSLSGSLKEKFAVTSATDGKQFLNSPSVLQGHVYSMLQVYRERGGELRFIMRNPYGNEYAYSYGEKDPCFGLVTLTLDQVRANFGDLGAALYRAPPSLSGNAAPTAPVAVATPSPAVVGQSVRLMASASDMDGDAVRCTWSRTGGPGAVAIVLDDPTGTNAWITFSAPGAQTLQAVLGDGLMSVTGTVSVTVTAVNDAPVIASCMVTPDTGAAPLAVTFAASAMDVDGDALTYTWNFGDGGTGVGAGANRTYTSNGTYVATLTVTDGRGGTATANRTITVTGASSVETVWVEDALPAGAVAYTGGDTWLWTNANPAPYSGTLAHRSAAVAGLHQHYFQNATQTLSLAVGDRLFTWVYLNPTNPPTEVMLQINDGSWEHRAYWGANQIGWGADGTVARRYMGPLPGSGTWVRLEVPAILVGLEGRTINGIAYALYGGQATWDRSGKVSGGAQTNRPPVAVADSATTTEDTAVLVNVLANDSDPDGDGICILDVVSVNGTCSIQGAQVRYAPASNWNGTNTFTYRVADLKGAVATGTVTVVVTPVNDTPAVAIASPTNGATFTAPATIAIQATASDVDGTVTKVEFFNGATKLGEDTTSPYAYTWSGVVAGSYTLTAKATDNTGLVGTSAGIDIDVAPIGGGWGLKAEFFDFTNSLSSMPDLTGRMVDIARVDMRVNYPSTTSAWPGLPATMADTFAARYTGLLVVPAVGTYTLYLSSDDGSRLWLDGAQVITNDGVHGMTEKAATLNLAAGEHALRIEFFEGTGSAGLIFSWAGPGIAKQVVPGSALRQSLPNQAPVALAGVDPIRGTTMDEYYFWGTDSYDPDGTIVGYQWTVNSETVSTEAEFLYTLAVAGTYNVVLTVTDDKGASASDLVQVEVAEPAVTVGVEVPDMLAGEPGLTEGAGRIRVKRTGDTSQPLTVNVALSGDAGNGVDYATVASTVAIPAGASYRDVTVSPLADSLDEPDKMVVLTVVSGAGYVVDPDAYGGLVMIKDQTYGLPVVSAEATDAVAKEPMQTTDKGAIKVSRVGSCHAALTVYCTLGGTAVNGVDYTTVTVPVVLAVGQSSRGLTIAPLADGVVESNETVVLTLTPNAAYQVAAGKGTATVTIQDATVLTTPVVSVVATDADAQEPAGGVLNYGYIRFARTSRFHESLTVNCAVGGTASNGVDYARITVPILFAAGEGVKDISIRPVADAVVEGAETAIFTLATGTGYTVDAAKVSATVSIRE